MYFEPAARAPEASHSAQACELCRTHFYPNPALLWSISRTVQGRAPNLQAVATKYYTHFVTQAASRSAGPGNEWSGVVELREPLTQSRANRELRALLAQSFDLDIGRDPDPALGTIALTYPLADFLPFIEGPPLATPGLKTWGFFWPAKLVTAPAPELRLRPSRPSATRAPPRAKSTPD